VMSKLLQYTLFSFRAQFFQQAHRGMQYSRTGLP